MKKRNNNIDFLRGIATIGIIVIHTAFYSGLSYLPSWFYNLTLLLDVPAFMFISGISFHYVKSFMKNITGILTQWKKWLYFLIFYTLIILVLFPAEFHIKDLISWMFYSFPNHNSLIVVEGSIWFMYMYIKVTIFSTIIICLNNYFVKEENKQISNLIKVTMLLFLIYSSMCISGKYMILDDYTFFYSSIYLLGYISTKYKINLKQMIVYEGINLVLLVVTFIGFHYTISDFQVVKFPPFFPYIFVAMPSVILFWYLKDKLKIKDDNKMNYIGRNAIQFYFAQGIASSFLMKICKYIPFTNPIVIFIIMLEINIACTTIGAIFLEKTYGFVSKKIKIKEDWFPRPKAKNEL